MLILITGLAEKRSFLSNFAVKLTTTILDKSLKDHGLTSDLIYPSTKNLNI